MNANYIKWFDLLDKLSLIIHPEDSSRFIDIRYLQKWIRLYPEVFPNFIHTGNYTIEFIPNTLEYIILEI